MKTHKANISVHENINDEINVAIDESKKSDKTMTKCIRCKTTTTLMGMKMHMKNAHGKQRKAVKTPRRRPVPQKIRPENLSFTVSLDDTDNTVALEETATRKYFLNCNQCDFDAETRTELMQHINATHKPNIPTSDMIIEDNIINKETITCITERNPNLPESLVICSNCAKAFDNVSQCEKHISSHSEPIKQIVKERIQCSNCDEEFETLLDLEWHIVNMKTNKPGSEPTPAQNKTCTRTKCDKTFTHEDTLNNHI